ncbi:helix-turn-helix transcriptional regulator [Sphaerisporangium krabiense]|uniref:DNA-binding CsgD family transcriptional regulator/tetratricopeptide (TPR) repeat protein n=1 Tax=Sphaerisporangium krabiense TaxID=763782 RepID=A0A7W8Z0P0_9ACTN|nr:helix-turn-helix transcriptional regulator [Sphaerisporangium krabiense]MBB5625319.1 DNA-binding CsgD family transcriptional regulator/tetratricopeptide (TPR) repeat protein [Sphaerisporangium krabiense]GII64167.1 helix-turn-helix transcriptional regulator [Sphaerisporangium krabiense]
MLADMLGRMVSPVFVGREDELRTLSEAFEQARKEAASAVLLGGEAGGGKTRLVTRFADDAAGAGAHVLAGGCVELSTEGLAYAPFTAALRQLVKEMGAAEVAALLPDGAARDLARLLPEFGEPSGDRETETGRARLFEQFLTLLERLAERRAVVLVIEDVHWADRSSRDLIAFLSRNLRTAPVMMVVTYRSDELHRQHPLRPVLAELGRVEGVVRLDLPRLSKAEVAAQIAGILGAAPEFGLVESVYQRSEGIPLFVEALMEREDDCNVPESLQDLIIGTVERLPEETQRVLRVAAAGGNRVGHPLLAAVTGLSDVDLESALRPAIARNVIQVADGRAYVFRHALIREAVHDEMLPGEHNRVHARFAEEIDRDRKLVPPGRAAIEMAHHWYSARDHLWALISAWEAAGKAARAFAYTEQIQLLERVLALWDRVPGAAERIGADHTTVLELASEAATITGETERGMKFVKGALAELDETAEPERVAALLVRRAGLKMDKGRRGGLEDLTYAERLVPEPGYARAHVLARLGSHLMFVNRTVEGARLTEEALGIARTIGDECLEAELLTNLALGQSLAGDLETTLRTNDRAAEIGRALKTGRIVLRALANNVDALNNLGRSEEAVELALEAEGLARKYGRYRVSGCFIANNRAEALTSLGRWDEAVEVVEQALAMSPIPKTRAYLLQTRADIAASRGEIELLERLLGELGALHGERNELAQEWMNNTRLLIDMHLLRGDPLQALKVTETLLSESSSQAYSSKPMLGWRALNQSRRTCEAAAAVDPEAACAVRARATEMAAALGEGGPVAAAFRLSFYGDFAAAEASWRRLGRPFPRARMLTGLAEAAATAGDRGRAAALLRQAHEIATALGARPLAGDVEALSRRLGAAVETPSPEQDGPAGLTPRETEVLRLVALGRSNRDIAGELFISAKTVSVHVSNILAKLGVSTRGEAAAAAHRHSLLA